MHNIPDLPRGYKERMDEATLTLMPEARRVMEICREFECETVNLSDGDIHVAISRVPTDNDAIQGEK